VLSVGLVSCAGCAGGPFAPSCDRQTGTVLDVASSLAAVATIEYAVTSPRHSNLIVHLTWSDVSATLGLRATLTGCGDHVGCQIGLASNATGPGRGDLRLTVDGTRGKQSRIDVTGDAAREQSFTLRVTFDTGTCT
jgi:hypothetical protein